MKKLFLFTLATALVVLSALFMPILLGSVGSIMLGAAFITWASEYNGAETIDMILRPMFSGKRPDTLGIRIVYTNGAGSIKIPVWDPKSKMVMPYASGWQGGSGANIREKKFEIEEFKAEVAYTKQTYLDTVYETIVNQMGIKQNDITGTTVHEAEKIVFQRGLDDDITRIFWLGDKIKRHKDTGTYPDGSTAWTYGDADKFYNVIDGIWTQIIALASKSATSTSNTIFWTEMANAAVKQERIETLTTGSGGTVGLTINGYAFTTTWASSDAATATAICSAANIAKALGLGVVMTNPSSGAIKLVSSVPGVAFTMGTYYTGETSPLATWTASGVVANTTNTALTTDEALAAFKAMFKGAPKVLKALRGSGKLVYLATDTMIDNYEDTLATGTGLESARRVLVDGISAITYKGIPILPMNIDGYLEADFPEAYPNRAILTTMDNLCFVLSSGAGFAETRFWFNPDANENRQRTQFMMGAGFMLPELMSIAF